MAQETRTQQRSVSRRDGRSAGNRDRSISVGPGSAAHPKEAHPLLALQQTVGNRVVQRLVADARAGRPRVIQRVLSPSTQAMGRRATSDLLSDWAGAYLSANSASQAANTAMTDVYDLLDAITMVQATLLIAETEPAPGVTSSAGGATSTQVPPPPAEQGGTQL